MIPSVRAAFLSDIGRVRSENQDRCLCADDLGLYGVADGVGGLPGGGEAAETATGAVLEAFRKLSSAHAPDLAGVVGVAHERVSELGRRVNPAYGIATTLTFGCLRGGRLAIAHVGDSRCYRWHNGSLRCLTEDHSVANEARRRGETSSPSYGRALVRCVGQLPMPGPDLVGQRVDRGDRYLFCTDGVTGPISDPEIAAILGRDGTPAGLLEQLIALVLRRGAPDNASGVLVFVDEI